MILTLAASALLTLAQLSRSAPVDTKSPVHVESSPPRGAALPIPYSFLSYSIEFAFLPDYAGNKSSPNAFSDNLLQNLGRLQGSNPILRIGGNTQDDSHYHTHQEQSIINTFDEKVSKDHPVVSNIGPAFFESFQTLSDTKFTYGFNMKDSNTSAGLDNVLGSAVAACNTIGDKLYAFEYGNEPDMYATWWNFRPKGWSARDIYTQWKNSTAAINRVLQERCHSTKQPKGSAYIAPSFAFFRYIEPIDIWHAGLNTSSDLKYFAQHNYVGTARDPGLTLQTTLMNHSNTVNTLRNHSALMTQLGRHTPYILGETNSLALQGKPGISDAFGAGLWNLDFALQAASIGIRRIHMHQGLNYRYSSWQPMTTDRAPMGTKPAYYGNIATAAFLGNLMEGHVQVSELAMKDGELDAGYAAYVDGKLTRIAVINLRTYNQTEGAVRPEVKYRFSVSDKETRKEVKVERLIASGSDALSGVTFGGNSYNYELDEGRPVQLTNVTASERLSARAGLVEVSVPDASAAILTFEA